MRHAAAPQGIDKFCRHHNRAFIFPKIIIFCFVIPFENIKAGNMGYRSAKIAACLGASPAHAGKLNGKQVRPVLPPQRCVSSRTCSMSAATALNGAIRR
ncbi:hypothetical protein [Vogesella indigofera]|uniref:hypothetical protein n=1 Tax=Vogesella indigofera TaxID=45465 RepID=UPI003F9006C2